MYYVNMVDKFMSGWGIAAKGRSIYIVECHTLNQASAIEKAAHERSEMIRITVTDKMTRRARGNDVVTIRQFSELGGPWLDHYVKGA